MPASTPRLALPYPLATEPVSQGDDAIKALAERVEALLPKTAAGSVYLGAPPTSTTSNVTFPSGRFTVAPMVTATVTIGSNVALIATVGNTTATGCTLYIYSVGSTAWSSGAVSVYWHAIEAL